MITNLLQYHLIHRIQHQITHRADRTAFRQWSPNGELQLTWGEAATRIDRIAAGLLGLGVEVQERIGIFANNTMARALTDLAILHLRGISVPLYSTNTPAQAAFVTNDADIRILFVGEQAQRRRHRAARRLPAAAPYCRLRRGPICAAARSHSI